MVLWIPGKGRQKMRFTVQTEWIGRSAQKQKRKKERGKRLLGPDFYPDRQRTPRARGCMGSLLHRTEGLEPFPKGLEMLRLDPRREDHPSFTGLTFDGLCADLL